ncbi:MAG: PilZ domain-containing protein [Desulfobulbaceae bacterium]|nr:PilZ domain-containing protein [Desulfobulbaceae bacterium]
MTTTKSFVRSDGSTTIICPKCRMAKNVPALQFKGKKHLLKVRCPCNETFEVQLDFRHHYRKKTTLPAQISFLDTPADGKISVQLSDISLSGIGFTINTPSLMTIGLDLVIEFNLDDKKNTLIKKKITVRNIREQAIGCEFTGNEAFEKRLGFYLQNN